MPGYDDDDAAQLAALVTSPDVQALADALPTITEAQRAALTALLIDWQEGREHDRASHAHRTAHAADPKDGVRPGTG